MKPFKKPGDSAADDEQGDAKAAAEETLSLQPFLDVPVNVTVELARKKLKVKEILNLHVDSIVHMDQSAGENVDLRLNGIAVGNGEIVVIEDMMGLRITDLRARVSDHE